jgi:hypothetical protein
MKVLACVCDWSSHYSFCNRLQGLVLFSRSGGFSCIGLLLQIPRSQTTICTLVSEVVNQVWCVGREQPTVLVTVRIVGVTTMKW